MKQVLITGSTSSQFSNEAQKRSPRFCGLLNTAFSYSGSSVQVQSVSVSEEKSIFDSYDVVIVGLAPFTSFSANNIINALNTVSTVAESKKLKILFDAPEPHLVYQSFDSILKNNSILDKSIYSRRAGHSLVVSNNKFRKSILKTMDFLLSGDYDVVVPSVPYFSGTRDIYGIPKSKSHQDLISLNFDQLFKSLDNSSIDVKSKYWLAENINAKWAKDISKTLSNPVLGVKKTQYDTEVDLIKRMQESHGYLLNTYKNGNPWWSPNISVALSCGTPVFSDWRYTGALGVYWSSLPHTVEDLSTEDRILLSSQQREVYYSHLNSFDNEVSKLNKTIFS